MTIPEDVNPLHGSYIELSARYKAAWTYHRFVEGLRKFFGNKQLADYPVDFQSLYKSLKEVSRRLNDPEPQRQLESLAAIRSDLARLIGVLDAEDRKITPSLLRLFFQRVKSQDQRILLDLVRFYQEIQVDRSWDADRIDKVDFLLARLAELIVGKDQRGDQSRLRRILEGISIHSAIREDTDPQRVANRLKMIQAVRSEIRGIESFAELTERELIEHYRGVKHGLGSLLFEKSVLPMVVDTNLVFRSRVEELSAIEEEQIFADYERVSALEVKGRIDSQLADSVNSLHGEVESFQKKLQNHDIRLADLAAIRRSVDLVLERLEVGAEEGARDLPLEEAGRADHRPTVGAIAISREERDLIGEELRMLLEGLETANETAGGALAASDLLAFRLETREMSAYESLTEGLGGNERIDRFLLAAAALRRKINTEVEEIQVSRSRGVLGGPIPTRRISSVLRLADWYLRQFSHFRETLLLAGNTGEAKSLDRMRMRLMRDYAGLWLVASAEPKPEE
ncbi:MAG: hypothetical protein OES47_10085 [Acidobacteriota bacterium]|nr:hypothetical protein [Acidobacteriota bacterium]